MCEHSLKGILSFPSGGAMDSLQTPGMSLPIVKRRDTALPLLKTRCNVQSNVQSSWREIKRNTHYRSLDGSAIVRLARCLLMMGKLLAIMADAHNACRGGVAPV